jgi:hypothetical protein
LKAFKYTLDKSSKKYLCPECGKKAFVRYVDVEGNLAAETYGRCDREVNCGYVKRPDDDAVVFVPYVRPAPRDASFMPKEHAISTYSNYEKNNFTKWLIAQFGEDRVSALINQYRFGVDNSSPYTSDWTIFWQYDYHGRIRSGKMIKYQSDGHRDKEQAAAWYHKRERAGEPLFPNYNLKQCLFGEHLLSNSNKPIAIVESEKTAIIASVFIDKYTWLACGGITQLSEDKATVLRGRSVTLFPDTGSEGKNGDLYIDKLAGVLYQKVEGVWIRTDIVRTGWDEDQKGSRYRSGEGPPKSAFDKWKEKARQYNFSISVHIERIASAEDKELGLDLADFLLR